MLSVPFLHVRDLAASLAFYVDVLGFSVSRRWLDAGRLRWCWLEQDGAPLMLQEFRAVPAEPLGIGLAVCFICDDAVNVYRRLTAHGFDTKRPFVGNDMWVTQTIDPDGYQIWFESHTDLPEGTEHQA